MLGASSMSRLDTLLLLEIEGVEFLSGAFLELLESEFLKRLLKLPEP